MAQYTASRELVVATCRALLERGYLKATEGNVSVRVPGRALFAVTPSNYDYAKMLPDDICVLDYDLHRVTGTMKASIEAGMHAAVYQHRPDVSVIIHTHQPYASALALMNKPIPALFDEQVRFLGRGVSIVGYAPSGTSFLKNRVKAKLKSGDNAYILANHGVLVLGRDTEHAMHNMALLEKVALDYLLTLLAGEKAAGIPLPIREIAFNKLRADEKKLAGQEAEAAAEAAAADRAAAKAAATAATAPADAGDAASLTGDGAATADAAADRRGRARGDAGRSGRGRRIGSPRRSEVRHQRVSRRRGRLRRPREPREPAAAQDQAEGHAAVPRLLRDQLQPLQGADRARPRSSSPAACSTTWPSTTRSRSPLTRPRAPTCGTLTATATSTSCRPADRPCWAATTRRVRDKVLELLDECGPVTGLFHEYELKLAELIYRFMPVGRDVPHARLRHRGGHGRHARGAHVHRQEVRHQDRRRLPRLERPDGLRAAHPRHVALRGPRHPLGATGAHPGILPERPACAAPQADREQACAAARRRSSSSRSARRAAPARCRSTSTSACASSATSLARC